jgi:hypothetical protein
MIWLWEDLISRSLNDVGVKNTRLKSEIALQLYKT